MRAYAGHVVVVTGNAAVIFAVPALSGPEVGVALKCEAFLPFPDHLIKEDDGKSVCEANVGVVDSSDGRLRETNFEAIFQLTARTRAGGSFITTITRRRRSDHEYDFQLSRPLHFPQLYKPGGIPREYLRFASGEAYAMFLISTRFQYPPELILAQPNFVVAQKSPEARGEVLHSCQWNLVSRDGFPLMHNHPSISFDDGRGVLLLGTSLGELCLAQFANSVTPSPGSILDDLSELDPNNDGCSVS